MSISWPPGYFAVIGWDAEAKCKIDGFDGGEGGGFSAKAAGAIGSNRTYVSNAINNAGGKSFADYVNSPFPISQRRLDSPLSHPFTALSPSMSECLLRRG